MRHIKRLATSVSLAFLLGSISLAAQSANNGAAQMQNLSRVVPNVNAACPVSLRAQHGADGSVRNVDKSRPDGVAQLLHLILTSKNSRQIVEAHLRVRGASGKGQLLGKLTLTDNTQSSMDATRNVTVKLRQTAENEVTGDTWIPGMSAVLEVELNSVTFDDGGMQRFGTADGCRFTPEHLMLIANDR